MSTKKLLLSLAFSDLLAWYELYNKKNEGVVEQDIEEVEKSKWDKLNDLCEVISKLEEEMQ